MSVEFIGYIATQHSSEIHPRSGPTVQPEYVEKVARAHEEAGFDRALVAYHSNSPDSAFVAAHAASVTTRQSATSRSRRNSFRQSACAAHAGSSPALCGTGFAPAKPASVNVITRRNPSAHPV